MMAISNAHIDHSVVAEQDSTTSVSTAVVPGISYQDVMGITESRSVEVCAQQCRCVSSARLGIAEEDEPVFGKTWMKSNIHQAGLRSVDHCRSSGNQLRFGLSVSNDLQPARTLGHKHVAVW